MQKENQVTNLEQSKKLKQLGVKRESLFFWIWMKGESSLNFGECPSIAFESPQEELDIRYYPAYTVAELGEMLPPDTETRKYFSYDQDSPNLFECKAEIAKGFVMSDTEVDARAKMLIHLLEHKLIEV